MKGINSHSECPVLDISIPCWKRQWVKAWNRINAIWWQPLWRPGLLVTPSDSQGKNLNGEVVGSGKVKEPWRCLMPLQPCSRENQLWSGAKSIYGYYGCLFVWVSVTFPLSFIKSIRSVEIAETFSFGQFLMWSHLQLFQLQMAPPQFFPSRGHMAMVWSPWPWPRRSLWCWVWRVRLWRAPRLGTSSPFRSRASCPAGHRPWCPTPRCGAGFDHGMAMAMLLRLGGMIGMQPLSLRSNGMEFYVVSRDAEKKAHNLVIGSERELLIFLLLVHLSW